MSEEDARITRILGLMETLWRNHTGSTLGALLFTIAEYSKHEDLHHVTDAEFEAFLSLYRTGGWVAINIAINDAEAERQEERKKQEPEDKIEYGIDCTQAEARLARIDPAIEAELEGRITLDDGEITFEDLYQQAEPMIDVLPNPEAPPLEDHIDEDPVEGHTRANGTNAQVWHYHTMTLNGTST